MGGSTFDFKYIHCTICVEVSLLNVNGAMQVLTVQTNPTNRPATLGKVTKVKSR